jgi:hypothetical protein
MPRRIPTAPMRSPAATNALARCRRGIAAAGDRLKEAFGAQTAIGRPT